MRYNPITDPGIAAGAQSPKPENHEGEEVAQTISSFSVDISGIVAALKKLFDMILSLFK
ncbi:MAG: hypothetical protein IK104_00045 [Clostridia bacterium]|nr:hypothetical protein [Clostridia bacterium]